MKAIISTQLNIPASEAWTLVSKSETLFYVCRGLLGFSHRERFPEYWLEGETLHTRLELFNLIPAWQHVLYFEKVSSQEHTLLTQEHGGIVKTWRHKIRFDPLDENSCQYTDEVDIEAGIFTPFVYLYANILYRYRQRRWQTLIKHRFD